MTTLASIANQGSEFGNKATIATSAQVSSPVSIYRGRGIVIEKIGDWTDCDVTFEMSRDEGATWSTVYSGGSAITLTISGNTNQIHEVDHKALGSYPMLRLRTSVPQVAERELYVSPLG